MSELPVVSPGEIIASSHINNIADRTLQRYIDVADRTAKNPTPTAGEASYLEDDRQVSVWDGSHWAARVLVDLGTEAFPGLAINRNADGIWGVASGVYGFVTDSINRLTVSSVGLFPKVPITGTDGTESAPAYGFESSTDTGMYYDPAAGGIINFAVAGVRRWFATVDQFTFVDTPTTGAAANTVISATSGNLSISTSARKYKSNIQDASDLAALDLVPVTFRHDGDDANHIGFIADDMPDDRAIVYKEDEVENYDLRAVVAILAAKVNDLTARLAALEA